MMLNGPRKWLLAALLGIAVALPQVAAGEDRPKECKRSQDCALDAFKSGEIRPLSEILAVARAQVPGEVVKVKLEREKGVWIYEMKILTPAGKRREVEINAQTLAVIKVD